MLPQRKPVRDACDRCHSKKLKCQRINERCRKCLDGGYVCVYSPRVATVRQPSNRVSKRQKRRVADNVNTTVSEIDPSSRATSVAVSHAESNPFTYNATSSRPEEWSFNGLDLSGIDLDSFGITRNPILSTEATHKERNQDSSSFSTTSAASPSQPSSSTSLLGPQASSTTATIVPANYTHGNEQSKSRLQMDQAETHGRDVSTFSNVSGASPSQSSPSISPRHTQASSTAAIAAPSDLTYDKEQTRLLSQINFHDIGQPPITQGFLPEELQDESDTHYFESSAVSTFRSISDLNVDIYRHAQKLPPQDPDSQRCGFRDPTCSKSFCSLSNTPRAPQGIAPEPLFAIDETFQHSHSLLEILSRLLPPDPPPPATHQSRLYHHHRICNLAPPSPPSPRDERPSSPDPPNPDDPTILLLLSCYLRLLPIYDFIFSHPTTPTPTTTSPSLTISIGTFPLHAYPSLSAHFTLELTAEIYKQLRAAFERLGARICNSKDRW
ncbi:MAG: hypothetical protein Q9195_006478, partial [Heterodermia aff. obscurata]